MNDKNIGHPYDSLFQLRIMDQIIRLNENLENLHNLIEKVTHTEWRDSYSNIKTSTLTDVLIVLANEILNVK